MSVDQPVTMDTEKCRLPALPWDFSPWDFRPTELTAQGEDDPTDPKCEVLMLAIPGDHLRESSVFSFAEHESGRQAKKALALLVRLWGEANKVIRKARVGKGAEDSGDESNKKKKRKGGKGGKGGVSSVDGGESEELDMGGDSLQEEELRKNAEASVRLIYLGMKSKENEKKVVTHTYWLVRQGGGDALKLDSRLDHIIALNQKREERYQQQKIKNKLRPLQRGGATRQTPDVFVSDVFEDWVRGTALWYNGYRVPDLCSQSTQLRLASGHANPIGASHDEFPAKAKLACVFDPMRGITRSPRDQLQDPTMATTKNYFCGSLQGLSVVQVGKNPWRRGVDFGKFFGDEGADASPALLVEIRGPMSVANFLDHCDPSYHILRVMPELAKIEAAPKFDYYEDEFAKFWGDEIGLPGVLEADQSLTAAMIGTGFNESAKYLAGEKQIVGEEKDSVRTPLHSMRDWYIRSFGQRPNDPVAAQWQAITYLEQTAMTDASIAESTHSLWRQVATVGSGLSGPEANRTFQHTRSIDPSMSSFANMMQRFHLDLEVGLGIAVTHNLVATLKQSLQDAMFFKEGKLMHNIMELGDAQSGKTHTMTTMQKLAVPDTVEMVHHITTHAFTTEGTPIIHKVIACDEAPKAWFASNDGSSVGASGSGNNPSEDVMKGILTSGRANVRRPTKNADTGNLEDGCCERLVAAAFWVCSNRHADTFSPAMASRFWIVDVNEVERDGRNISDKQIQEELDVERSSCRQDTDADPDFRLRATAAFRSQQSVIFLCAIMQDFAGMSRPCKVLVPIVVGRMRDIFRRYGFVVTPRITSQISRLCNVFCHEDAYHRNFRTIGGRFASGDFYPKDLFDRDRTFESDLIVSEEHCLQALWWVWSQFIPFSLIRTMQLILSYIEAGCCDFTRLFLVPFVAVQHAGDGMGAAADDYVEPTTAPSLVDRLDFDMLHFSAESLEEFAEKLVAHQQLKRAGAVNDGAMALSARTIISRLRALHDTSWGQTRHAEQKIVICNTAMGQSDLQSVARLKANKDGRGVTYDDLVDTGTEFRRLMKAGDRASAYKHFPFEFADCEPALEAAIALSTVLPPAAVWEHAMNDEIIEITSIVRHAGTMAKDSHVPWLEDEVRAARGKTAVLLQRFKESTPLDLELSQTQHTVIADALVVLVARLTTLGNVRLSTSTSFQDETFKTKTLKISSHMVRTLGDPLYLNNIRRRVMADYAHNATETRHVLVGMSSFGHSANDDKPYLLEYDILRKNPYENIEFPNQNFLDSKTFNLLLPPDPDNLTYDQPVPQAMRHDYQALNPEHNMDRFAALHHLTALGVEINEFRVFWADRSKEITFDRVVFQDIRRSVVGGWQVWDVGMTYPAKMKLVREKLCEDFAVYLDKDPELVAAEVTPADFGPTLDHRGDGWRRRLYALSWRLMELDQLARDPVDPEKLLFGQMRKAALIPHRSARQMRARAKKNQRRVEPDDGKGLIDSFGKRLKVGMSRPIDPEDAILLNVPN